MAYVDVDLLAGIPEKKADWQRSTRRLCTPAEITEQVIERAEHEQCRPNAQRRHPGSTAAGRITSARRSCAASHIARRRLAILSPAVPDTLILNPIG